VTARFVLAGVLIAAAAEAGEGRDKGFAPAVSTAEALDAALAPRRVAVLVGVDTYEDPAFPDLRHAAADARDLGAALARATGGGFDEVKVVSGAASRAQVLSTLRATAAQARREDALVVYFSGHGTRTVGEGGARRFLLASDTRAADLAGTAIDLEDLQRWFSSTAPLRKALILDACFHGGGKSALRPGTPAEPLDAVLVPRPAAMAPAEAWLFATSAGRPAREDDALGHGVYTAYLLDALSWGFGEADRDRDGVVTAFEAHDYARGRTMARTAGVQVPEAVLRLVGEADLVLAGDAGARRAADAALVYLYGPASDPMHGARVLVDGRDRGIFPGTVAVPPGVHTVEIVAPDGRRLVSGATRLEAGERWSASDLAWALDGPTHRAGVRAVWTASDARLGSVIGPGAVGVEAWTLRQTPAGPARGLYREGGVGVGAAPSRQAGTADAGPRPAVSAHGAVGLARDGRWVSARVGLGGSLVLVPPQALAPGADRAAEVGWWISAVGPTATLGTRVGRGWSVEATLRPHLALLDVDGSSPLGAIPWVTAGVGLDAGW